MDSKTKVKYDLAVEVKLHCLATKCVNNMGEICNLKGVAIDPDGKCAGLVIFTPDEKEDN